MADLHIRSRKFKSTDCPVEHRWKSVFCNELSRLGELNVYVDPLTRRMHTRQPVRRKPKRLPPNAVLVGRYRRPAKLSEFIADMHATMALFSNPSRAQQ